MDATQLHDHAKELVNESKTCIGNYLLRNRGAL